MNLKWIKLYFKKKNHPEETSIIIKYFSTFYRIYSDEGSIAIFRLQGAGSKDQRERDRRHLSAYVDVLHQVADTGFSLGERKSNSCWVVAVWGCAVHLVLYVCGDDDDDDLLSTVQVSVAH